MGQQKQSSKKQEVQKANRSKVRIEGLPVEDAPDGQDAQIKGGMWVRKDVLVSSNTPPRP